MPRFMWMVPGAASMNVKIQSRISQAFLRRGGERVVRPACSRVGGTVRREAGRLPRSATSPLIKYMLPGAGGP